MQAAGLQASNPLRSQHWGLPDPCWGLLRHGPSSAAAARQPLGVMLIDAPVRQPSPHLLRASTCWGFFLFCFNGQIRPVLSQSASSLRMGYEHSTGQLEPHSTSTGWMQPRLGHDPPPSNFLQLKSHPERNHTTRCLFVVVGVGFFAHSFLIVSFIYLTFLDGHMKEGTCLPYPSDWVINRNESSDF